MFFYGCLLHRITNKKFKNVYYVDPILVNIESSAKRESPRQNKVNVKEEVVFVSFLWIM